MRPVLSDRGAIHCRSATRLRWLVIAMALCITPVAGCSRSLKFTKSDAVHIIQPAENAEVALPLQLSWTAPPGTRVAVFLDRTPMAPGKTIESQFNGGKDCDPTGCLDGGNPGTGAIYETDGQHMDVPTVDDLRLNDHSNDLHQVTIVFLDGAGKRLNEDAFIRNFVVKR